MFGRRILVLIPHADDEVVGCAAAIGRARAAGAEVIALYLTTGIPDRTVFWPWQRRHHADRVARRRREARATAELLGLRPWRFLDIPARCLKGRLHAALGEARRAIADTEADMVWAPAYEGGHQDHDSASFLASHLRDLVPVWEFAEYGFAGGIVRRQEFPEANGSEQALALTADEMALKRRALALYASETGNLGYVGTARECFRPQADYDYRAPPHPGKAFYQRFQWVPFRHPRIDFTTPAEVCRALARFG